MYKATTRQAFVFTNQRRGSVGLIYDLNEKPNSDNGLLVPYKEWHTILKSGCYVSYSKKTNTIGNGKNRNKYVATDIREITF